MKKNLNELFDRATPQEMEQFSDALNAPALSNEALASVKNKVYAKTKLNRERRSVKVQWLRVGALAACLCLLVTGIFGGVGLLKNQFGDATAPMTQHAPDLPLDHYPNGEVDYANMSMVEYMELFPDFLSYRYMPWEEGYAFAHLEILEVKGGYNKGDGKYSSYVVKCRVVADAWNVLEEGSELNLVGNYKIKDFFGSVSAVLIRFPVGETFPYENKDGEKGSGILFEQNFKFLGCFPLEDGKVNLEIMEKYLKENNLKLNYVGNSLISNDPDYVYCTFDDVASIVADEMNAETALENLRNVYEKYQTGEYNYVSVKLASQMTYGDYCRMIEGTLTKEDFSKYGVTTLGLEYVSLPSLATREFSLSDGTVFELCTRIEIPDSYLPELLAEIDRIEKLYTDEKGVINSQKCIEEIQAASWLHSFKSILHTFYE